MALTQQLTVTATPASGGESANVTSTASYASDDTNVATVSGSGLITAHAVGTATVTASYQGGSDTCVVTVEGPPIVEVTPPSVTLTLE